MPWNDNANPGPWGSPPPENRGGGTRGPKRPSGPAPKRPGPGVSFEEYQRRFNDWLRGPGGGRPRPRAIAMLVGGAIALFLLSGTYIVQPNEQAVVSTFGAYTRTAGPGLRYRAPLFEKVEKIPVTTLQRTDVGGVPGAEQTDESLMLTGDENIVDLSFSVTWRVSDPVDYVFKIKDPDATVKAVAESAMREVVGHTALQPLISTGRGQVQQQTVALMQQMLDSYEAGIRVDEVQIRNAGPPKQVVEAFREVATAQQNAESATNVARGEAARIVQAAIGYRAQVTREAAGEAARFNQVYEQYRLAPAVTRERLYIETMQRVLANSNKVIVQGKNTNAPIILPSEVFRPKNPQAAGAAQ